MAQNNYRSTDAAVTEAHAADFPQVKLVTVDEVFGGWDKIKTEHLAEGAILDKVFVNQ
jgi:sulfate transport system substrate-binding protein